TLLYLAPATSLGAAVADANAGKPEGRRFGVALLISPAVAASIGGMATPIGTAPNMILVHEAAKTLRTEISFASWMKIGIPLAVLLAAALWATLVFVSCRIPRTLALPPASSTREPWTPEERRTGAVFAITVVLWITREDIPLLHGFSIPGWSTVLERAALVPAGAAALVKDGTVA